MNRRDRLAPPYGSTPSPASGPADAWTDVRGRERALSRALGIQVVIDRTGWVRSEPEVTIHRDEDGQIYPLTVKMSPDASDDMLVGERPVNALFIEYNRLLQTLRLLAKRAEAEVVRLEAASDSPIGCVQRELGHLERVVAQRQARTMGNNSVRLSSLDREVAILRQWDEELTPIVIESETQAVIELPNGARGRVAKAISWLMRRPLAR